MSNKDNGLYEFGGFRFDPFAAKLWRGDELILLSPKAAELLGLLLERQGEFVSKEEIFEKIWPETFVEDGVLTQNVYTLRKALGKTEDGIQLIENKTRLGYRITVPVKATDHVLKPGASAPEIPAPQKTGKWKHWLAAAGILLAAFALVGWVFFRQRLAAFRTPIESVKYSKLTNTGDVESPTLSPDSKLMAYVKQGAVYLKDLPTDQDIKLNIEGTAPFGLLQFSADGNFLYFSQGKGTLFKPIRVMKVSRFGGVPQVILDVSTGSFSVSPDNKFIAYLKMPSPEPKLKLIVRNLETSEERELSETEIGRGMCYECSPAWSPDGKKLAYVGQPLGNNVAQQIVVIDVDNGAKEEIQIKNLRRFGQATWLPEGNAFIIAGADTSRLFHLWKVSYPSGEMQRVTTGLSSFSGPNLSANGKSLLVQQTTDLANIFTAEAEKLSETKQLTTGNTNDFGLNEMIWAGSESILYTTQTEKTGIDDLWLMDSSGQNRRQVTNESFSAPAVPDSDGKHIYFNSIRHGAPNLFRVNVDGTNLVELTKESTGMRRASQISPDGNWLYYIYRNRDVARVMRRSMIDQSEEVVFENPEVIPGFQLQMSPDGKFIGFPHWKMKNIPVDGNLPNEVAVVSLENQNVVKFVPIMLTNLFRFSPDSRALDFVIREGEDYQLMRQSFDEAKPSILAKFPKERIFNFDWSKDGKRIALSKGESIRDAVLLTEFGN